MHCASTHVWVVDHLAVKLVRPGCQRNVGRRIRPLRQICHGMQNHRLCEPRLQRGIVGHHRCIHVPPLVVCLDYAACHTRRHPKQPNKSNATSNERVRTHHARKEGRMHRWTDGVAVGGSTRFTSNVWLPSSWVLLLPPHVAVPSTPSYTAPSARTRARARTHHRKVRGLPEGTCN